MKFRIIDIAKAYAAYGALYHEGQGSESYRNLCRAQAVLAKFGLKTSTEPQELSENGLEIYQALGGKIDEKPCQDCGLNTLLQPCRRCIEDYKISLDWLETQQA